MQKLLKFLQAAVVHTVIWTLFGVTQVYAQSNSMGETLVGQWRNVSIRVEVQSFRGMDSTRVFTADERNWVEKLGIKPIRTLFKADSTYESRYYAPNDSLMMKRKGNWKVRGDTLFMQETIPDSTLYITNFSVLNDTARFEMMLDWDQDGKKDDHYYGKQVRTQKE